MTKLSDLQHHSDQDALAFVSAHTPIMKTISHHLKGYGIEHFHYIRVYSNGMYLHLVDDPDFIQFYIENIQQISPIFLHMIHQDFAYYLWPQDSHDKLFLGAQAHNICHGYSLANYTKTYYESWSFSTHRQNPGIINTYVNIHSQLHQFIQDFHKKYQSLIEQGCQHMAKFESLGFDFYQTKGYQRTKGLVLSSSEDPIPITTMQTKCLRLLAHGYTNKYIAKLLQISPYTVETHMKMIKEKLNTYDHNALVDLYWKHQHILDR